MAIIKNYNMTERNVKLLEQNASKGNSMSKIVNEALTQYWERKEETEKK